MTPASRLLTLAAESRGGLLQSIERLRALSNDDLDAALRRPSSQSGPERLAISGPLTRIREGLDAAAARLPSLTNARWVARPAGVTYRSQFAKGRVAFLFPGQGSEHIGMLRYMRARSPIVRRWFETMRESAAALSLPDPMAVVEPPDEPEVRAVAQRALHRMEVGAQLGSVAALAMHEVARAIGLRADVHLGHSNGEHPAVIAAGRIAQTPSELCAGFLRLGQAGARLPAPPQPEKLLTIAAMTRREIEKRVSNASGVYLAMHNCPSQSVVGGIAPAVDEFGRSAREHGIVAPLPFERAYHTPLFDDWSSTLAAYYAGMPFGAGNVPVFSAHLVARLSDDPETCRREMTEQWTGLVRFADAIEALHAEGVRAWIELGPAATLTAFVDDVLRGRPHVAVSLDAGLSDAQPLHSALAELFVAGEDIDPARVDALLESESAATVLPAISATDEAQIAAAVHRRLIVAAREQFARVAASAPAATAIAAAAPLLGTITTHTADRLRARQQFTRAQHPFVDHHALGRRSRAHRDPGAPLPVIPFTMSLEIVAEAARAWSGGDVRAISNIRASRWLALDQDVLDIDIELDRNDAINVRLLDRRSGISLPAFEATINSAPVHSPAAIAIAAAAPPTRWSAARFYDEFAFHGPAFQGIREVTAISDEGIVATLEVLPMPGLDARSCVVDPALLDCSGQLVAMWLLEAQRRKPDFGVFPFRVGRLDISRPPLAIGERVTAIARVRERHGLTTADVSFIANGVPLMSVHGLEQRIVQFPPACRRRLIDGDATAVPGQDEADFLVSSFQIWERTLAHLALPLQDRDAWAAHPGPPDARVRWLLDALTRLGSAVP